MENFGKISVLKSGYFKATKKEGIEEYEVKHENGVFVGDFVLDVDGYYKYWPADRSGYYIEGDLFLLFTMLKRLNSKWDNIVKNDPNI